MIIFFAILGITLPLLLIYYHAKKFSSVYYLGGFFLLVSLYGINHYILIYSRSVLTLSIFLVNIGFLFYLIGPLFYFYIRSILTDDYHLKKRDVVHLLPMVLWLVNAIPYMLTPYAYKLLTAREFIAHHEDTAIFNHIYFDNLLIIKIMFLSRPFLIFAYILWSASLLVIWQIKNKPDSVFRRQKFMHGWIYLLTGIAGLLSLSHLVVMAEAAAKENLHFYLTMNILQVISAAGLAGLLISPFFFPEILYGLPRLPKTDDTADYTHPGIATNFNRTDPADINDNNKMDPPAVTSEPSKEAGRPESHAAEKKSMLNLETGYLQEIGNMADACMIKDQPYLHLDFNLVRLAVMINIPVHHLAYYFREIKRQNFTDYRNHWRILYAKKLMREGKAGEITLEAIGMLSGFSSRNTFLTAFKKEEGVSPGIFASHLN